MNKAYPEIMTTLEVVEYLRISRKTLMKLIHEKKIPAKKIGKDYRYLKSELDKYLRGTDSSVNYFNS